MSAVTDAASTGAGDGPLAVRLLGWFDRHGRHDLPWQQPRTAYRVWLSEVMLQQTQVAVARGYFLRFVDALPTLAALAAADEDQVLALWSGLGYYSRARNLHRTARLCVERHGGELPRDFAALLALPGIGRSTAGAILAQAHGERFAILDGNVKRLLARLHGVRGWPGAPAVERRLWQLAESALPVARLADYTQALMDFGATRCTRARPACGDCPLQQDCVAFAHGVVAELPERRPRRALPTRQVALLLAEDEQARVLLERRPPSGVWGGLWSLPEASDEHAAAIRLAALLGSAAPSGGGERLAPLLHVFTHFRLQAQPVRWRVASRAMAVGEDHLRWFGADELAALGLPAPIRALLARDRASAATL